MSYLKNLKWEMVLYSILAIAIGVLMFLYPTKTLNAVCIILAVMLFALGIRYLIEYRKKNFINDFYRYEFVAGIALILLGKYLESRSKGKTNTFNYYLCNCIDNNSQWTYENRECIRP